MPRKSQGRTMITINCSLCEKPYEKELRRYKEATGKGVDKFYCTKECMKKRAALPHIQKVYKENGPKLRNTKDDVWRFVEMQNLDNPDTCWVWTGCLEKGYGVIVVNQKHFPAHRLVYETVYNEDITGIIVCHKCDNPPCVRPDHLFLGTRAENLYDMVNKGRHIKGSQTLISKLTEEDVTNIRQTDNQTSSLAKAYNVSKTTIKRIKANKTWKHVK